jgi:hypothetical protein
VKQGLARLGRALLDPEVENIERLCCLSFCPAFSCERREIDFFFLEQMQLGETWRNTCAPVLVTDLNT